MVALSQIGAVVDRTFDGVADAVVVGAGRLGPGASPLALRERARDETSGCLEVKGRGGGVEWGGMNNLATSASVSRATSFGPSAARSVPRHF